MALIVDTVKSIRVGEPALFRSLAVFPLFGSGAGAADYLTLDEALEQKCSEVTEVSEGGSVPDLKFVNSGKRPVFLLDGEQLIGAKQNRILNLSILVAGGRTIIIPVSCVEAGRWRHRTSHFSSDQSLYYAEGRARKMAQVSLSLSSTGQRRSDQSKVWEDIREKSSRFSVVSDTSAMSDIFEKEEARLKDYEQSFQVREGQSGAVFAINGKIVGLDLFDSAETLKKLFPKLLQSYGLDALDHERREGSGRKAACGSKDVDAFLKGITEAEAEEFDAVGEGRDVRLSGKELAGAALIVDNRVIHMSAFAVK
jgi:hypothetical protein